MFSPSLYSCFQSFFLKAVFSCELMSKTNAVMNFLMLRVSTILFDTAYNIREALNLKNADFLFSLSVGCVVGFFLF